MSHLTRSAEPPRAPRHFAPIPPPLRYYETAVGEEAAVALSCPAETARALISALAARDWQGAKPFLADNVMIAGALGDAAGRVAVLTSCRDHLSRDALRLRIQAMDEIDGSVIVRSRRFRLVLEYNAAGAIEAITVSRAPARNR